MSSCSFTPDWCKKLATIPDMSCEPLYTIKKLPTHLPRSMPSESLRTAYGFTSDSQNIIWIVVPIFWGAVNGEVHSPTEGVFCHEATDRISGDGVSGVYIATYPYFYTEAGQRNSSWVITADRLCCDGVADSATACITCGPAPQPPKTEPILPTPTFVPKVANVRIDKSLKAFMNAKSGTLAVTPPEEECEEGAKPVLVYNAETEMAEWECQKHEESCCPALIYDGELVVGVTDQGSLITKPLKGYTFANPFEANDYIVFDD